MEVQSDLCITVLRFFVVFSALCISVIRGDGRCRRQGGTFANKTSCVGNLTCQHYRDRLVISWSSPQDRQFTLDFLIEVSNVEITVKEERIVNKRSNNAVVMSTSPRIDFSSRYNVTIKRRYSSSDLNLAFLVKEECTKVYVSSVSIGVTPDSFSKSMVSNGIVTRTLGEHDQGSETATSGLDQQYVIVIVLSVAVVVALLIVLVLARRCYRQKRIRNLQDIGTKGNLTSTTTTDQPCEGDTYNHLTLRYQEKKTTQERISQDTYAHITEGEGETSDQLQMNSNNTQPQLSRRYDANYDDIPYEYDESNKTKKATVNIGTTISDNVNENGSTADVLQGPITGDVYATVDKSYSKSNGDTLSRVEGPQGDLYTEVAIKR